MIPPAFPDLSHLPLVRQLGLDRAGQELDALAAALAEKAGAEYAMINFFHPVTGVQYFLGLASPTDGSSPPVERTMAPNWGFCPEVRKRTNGLALVLADVCDKPRFAGNPVVDQLGIRTYAGAPIIPAADDSGSGEVWGTVCFVGTTPRARSASKFSLALIKDFRDQGAQLVFS